MDPNTQGTTLGPNGRRLHIAHRRSPSELTPLMGKLPFRHQIVIGLPFVVEMLSQGSNEFMPQQLAHQNQINMNLLQAQQQMPNYAMQSQMQGFGNFQFPQGLPAQHLAVPMSLSGQQGHRRNQSSTGMGNMGPPPQPQGLFDVIKPN